MYRKIRVIDIESVDCREEVMNALKRNNDLRRDNTVSFPVLSAFETKLHHTFGTTSMKWFAFGMLPGLGPTVLTPELLFTLLSFLLKSNDNVNGTTDVKVTRGGAIESFCICAIFRFVVFLGWKITEVRVGCLW